MTDNKTRPQATPTVQIDNPRTLVTEWRFPPGAETGWHQHQMDYVVVPLTSGTLQLETDSGINEASLHAGSSYFREKGVRHNVINANDYEFVFVEIEFR